MSAGIKALLFGNRDKLKGSKHVCPEIQKTGELMPRPVAAFKGPV